MAKRNKGIIAYGTEKDREMLSVLAHITRKSASDWIIGEIRRQYREAFGETPPERIAAHQ